MVNIEKNLSEIRKNIEEAAAISGRKPSDIQIIGVTKTIGTEKIRELLSCGISEFGENRVQELLEKHPHFGSEVNWHLIGHLQTNKVKSIIDKVKLIHSVDSLRLGEEINKQASKQKIIMDILIEINIAGEETKYGITPEKAKKLADELSCLESIRIKGLMTVAPITENPEENRIYFKRMYELFNDLKQTKLYDMQFLSMGMTGDYHTAITEGANIVRIGTGIFGDRA